MQQQCRVVLAQVRVSRRKDLLRITEAAVLAAITIVIMIVLSWTLGTCVEVPEWLDNGYGITFHCEDGKAFWRVAVKVCLLSINGTSPCCSMM